MGRPRRNGVAHDHVLSGDPSTKSSYQAIFFSFVNTFERDGLNFASLNVNTVLSFLQSFVGKSSSRVRTAVAALKFFLRVYHREDFAFHPLITLFGKGAQNLAPLPREKGGIWNPEVILDWLKSQLVPSAFLKCAKEAILLLLLATGWRVDDVWKLANKCERLDEFACFFFSQKTKMSNEGFFHGVAKRSLLSFRTSRLSDFGRGTLS
jgi:hypothetical protein